MISRNELSNWSDAFSDIEAYYHMILMDLHSGNKKLTETFDSRNLNVNSVLYKDCLSYYFTFCSWNNLMKEGVITVLKSIKNANTTSLRERIMMNVLRQTHTNKSRIITFDRYSDSDLRRPFDLFLQHFGKPDKLKFGEDQDAFETYNMTFILIFTKNNRPCPQSLDFTGFLSTFH